MSSNGFMYRRLARFMPCVFSHVGTGNLSLSTKYDIASLRDVFMSRHYWRAFEHLESPPKLIVDLGAHCGHFSVLCHLALLERFGSDTAEYVLVEGLPSLIPKIRNVVEDAGFSQQVKIVQGLVGKKGGEATFQTDPKNLLSSKAVQDSNSKGPKLAYRDFDSIVPSGTPIDILKIDIEGSEHDLIRNYPHVFQSAQILLIEVHGSTREQASFESELAKSGLNSLSPAIVKEHERLLCYGLQPSEQTVRPVASLAL